MCVSRRTSGIRREETPASFRWLSHLQSWNNSPLIGGSSLKVSYSITMGESRLIPKVFSGRVGEPQVCLPVAYEYLNNPFSACVRKFFQRQGE